jgi:hypothetical protein
MGSLIYMHVKKIKKIKSKLEPAIDEMYGKFIVNLEADSDNDSSDTELTSDGEMSGVDPLDSGSDDNNRPTVQPSMAQGLSKCNILYCLCITIKTTSTLHTRNADFL